jgi:hypothetical protein
MGGGDFDFVALCDVFVFVRYHLLVLYVYVRVMYFFNSSILQCRQSKIKRLQVSFGR